MTISLPDIYTIENSKQNILSIRLNPGGLSFSLYNPVDKTGYIYRELTFDSTVPYVASLKECFFQNSFFTWPFSKVRISTLSPIYTLIPDEFFEEKNLEYFLKYNFTYPVGHSLCNPLEELKAVLAFQLDTDVYEFCSRSFILPEYYHHLTPLLLLWKKQSLAQLRMQMYLYIHPGFIDIVCFQQGQLKVINSFAYKYIPDILYYILYVWKQTGMDQLRDMLHVAGEVSVQNEVIREIQIYLNNIQPVEVPSEAYLRGGEILNAPLDLICLSL